MSSEKEKFNLTNWEIVSVNPVEEAPKTEELKKEDKKVEAKAEKQTSEKK